MEGVRLFTEKSQLVSAVDVQMEGLRFFREKLLWVCPTLELLRLCAEESPAV